MSFRRELREISNSPSTQISRSRSSLSPPRVAFTRVGGVIFTRARVSLALLSLRKNGGLLVVYNDDGGCENLTSKVNSRSLKLYRA